jgi:nicotinamide phosphoribosyltransferase
MIKIPCLLQSDSYKQSHEKMYPAGMTRLYSNLTPRKSRINGIEEVVVFGIQAFIKDYLIDSFNEFFNRPLEEVLKEYKKVIFNHLGPNISTDKVENLHKLGYVPLRIKCLPEGSICPIQCPILTIENTHPDFAWLTNFIETILCTKVWQPITSATIAKKYREILDEYALATVGNTDFVQWQGHSFAMRGMSSLETAMSSDAGHLLSFTGSDTIPAILWLETFYNANCEEELISGSVMAEEHSIACAFGKENEVERLKKLLTEVSPTGIVSVIGDTWNIYDFITRVMKECKNEIMNRDGKCVCRPDSSPTTPVEIICGVEIEDYTDSDNIKTLDDAKHWAHEDLVEKIRKETPHGEYGDCEPECIFKYEDKFYRLKSQIEWNRYDKQYYYIDGDNIVSCEEYIPTPDELGVVELLWNEFGGIVNKLGYKELDSHVSCIYGDSISLEYARQICQRLKNKGFASNNVILGIGSYTYQYNTRDTFGMAMKATYCMVNNEEREMYKEPITDPLKKSRKGLLTVERVEGKLQVRDCVSREEERASLLEVVFEDGVLVKEYSLSDIRERLKNA